LVEGSPVAQEIAMASKSGGPRTSDFADAFQARGPGAAARSGVEKTPPISSPWPTILLIMLVGVGGFVGLLVSSHYFPTLANPLRAAGLVWFFGFGVIQTTLIRRQR